VSRIGLQTIYIPEGVEVSQNGNLVTVEGKNGKLTREINSAITMNIENNEINFERSEESKKVRSLHGTTRSNVNNMIVGVSEGFQKDLELVGVGYRAQKQGDKLVLNVGLSHPVEFETSEDIEVEVPSNTEISIKGPNKESVGQLAAKIRGIRPPEPYKGKGIKYKNEQIIRKEGKTGK